MKKLALLSVIVFVTGLLAAQTPEATTAHQVVDSLIQRNKSLVGQQAFAEAFQVIETAEMAAGKAFGKHSAAYASCLFYHGRTFFYEGKYTEAEPFYEKALAIQQTTPGKEHADYASTLNGLGNVYRETARYEKAEPCYVEAKNIRERVLGRTHPLYASSLNNLASLYYALGQYDRAEALYLESKDIREQTVGKTHTDYAASLTNLAILYTDMGQYKKAEALTLEGLEIERRTLGLEHPDYAKSLDNLAVLYFKMNQYEKAEPLYLESLKIREKVLGREHRDYAYSLGNLADLYFHMGQYQKSEDLQLEIVDLRKQETGTNAPEYAMALSNLGFLYMATGRYEKAEPLFMESRDIRATILGREHTDYVYSLQNLAELFELQQRYADSEKLLAEAAGIQQSRLNKAVSFLSEKELADYTGLFEAEINRMFNFIRLRHLQNKPEAELAGLCYNNLLFYKGYLLSAVNRINSLAASSDSTNAINNELKSYRRLLSKSYAQPVSDRDETLVANLEEKANALEKKLSALVSGYAQSTQPVDWTTIRAQLKPDQAALEFVRYPCDFPKETDSILYAVLLLRADGERPMFIPLFEEKQLIRILSAGKEPSQDTASAGGYSRGIKPLNIRGLKGLYDLVWKPIEAQLKDIKTVCYAPSGLLHRISFDAIPSGDGTLLADQFKLVRLGSTGRLAFPDTLGFNTGKDAVLYGGIRYDEDSSSVTPDTNAVPTASLSFTSVNRSSTGQKEYWAFLPGTEKEVAGIAGLLKTHGFSTALFSGSMATEASIKSLSDKPVSPRILHIATHGFFFADPKDSNHGQAASPDRQAAFKVSEQPMIRSGLLLAGANQAWNSGKRRDSGQEDGILTAYEISQMDLHHTELVVLSACETGLGDIQGNEGVYGLQRAFKIAGVKYLIMSLWKVPDDQTVQLMTEFYKNWLEEQMEIPEAFRSAQKRLREQGLEPYFWAGFVLVE